MFSEGSSLSQPRDREGKWINKGNSLAPGSGVLRDRRTAGKTFLSCYYTCF